MRAGAPEDARKADQAGRQRAQRDQRAEDERMRRAEFRAPEGDTDRTRSQQCRQGGE